MITQYNEKQMSNGIFKFVKINMKHLSYEQIYGLDMGGVWISVSKKGGG